MEKKYTYCRICEGSCGFIAEVENNCLLKYYPDKNHPVSKGYSCIKGRFMVDVQNDPKRIKNPLKKVGTTHQVLSWDKAIDEIGTQLMDIRTDSK